MYQLLLDRKLGDYKLHPKVAIICSMNHSKESGGGHFNSAAVKSRLSLMEYVFNFDDWYTNFGLSLHPWLSSFLKANQQYIIETESKTLEPSGSARSYSKLSLEFNLYNDVDLNEMYKDLASGVLSINAVNSLEKHVIYYQKIDFTGIVKHRTIPTLSSLPDLDKVLWGYVFHSVVTPEDGVYIIDLINAITTQPHYQSLLGFLSAEIHSKYKIQLSGETITPGQNLVLSKIMGSFDPSLYKVTAPVAKKLAEAELANKTEVMSLMAKYM